MSDIFNTDYAKVEARSVGEFSLLRDAICKPLPIALAHDMAVTKPGDPRMVMLNRLFSRLTWAAQQQCKAELQRCREAVRGQHPAEVQ